MTHAQDAEVARLRAQVAELSRPHRTLRSTLSAILMVLVLVLTPLAVVASWTSSLLGDTDRYVATMGPLVDDRAVQEAVGARAAQAVTKHLDLDTLLQEAAPEDRPMLSKALGKLGSPIEGAVASFVGKEATNVVASSWFQTFWTDANRRIHAAMVKALTGQGGGAVKLTDDAVTIDLAPVIDQLKQRLVDAGLGVAAKVPEIHTDFTVVQSKDVKKAQTGFRLLQILGTWLAVVVVLIAALAVWLARRRRRALTTVALLIAAGALLLGLGLVIARALYLDALPAGSPPTRRPPCSTSWCASCGPPCGRSPYSVWRSPWVPGSAVPVAAPARCATCGRRASTPPGEPPSRWGCGWARWGPSCTAGSAGWSRRSWRWVP